MRLVQGWGALAIVCAVAGGLAACGGSSKTDADGSGGSNSGSGGSSSGSGGSSSGSGGSSSGSGGSNSGSGGSSSGGGNSSQSSGSNTTGQLLEGDPIPLEDYPAAVAEAFCPAFTPCCQQLDLNVSTAECITFMSALLAQDHQAADPNNYSYDPELAGDCVATAKPLYEDLECRFDDSQNPDFTAVGDLCDRVFTGKLEPGSPCTSDVECATGAGEDASCDELDFESSETVCIVERRAAQGESCYWTCTDHGLSTSCSGFSSDTESAVRGECWTNDGLACGSEGVCEVLAAVGEPCESHDECSQGFCTSGTCAAPGDEGDECDIDANCGEGLFCSDSEQCTPKLAEGAPCTLSDECAGGLCSGGSCVGDSGASEVGVSFICALLGGGN